MEIKELLPNLIENVVLAPLTTFKIGGLARHFYIAKSKEDLILAIKAAKKAKMPFFILGGGSNLLVSDNGYEGLVIKVQNTQCKIKGVKIYSEAGAVLPLLVFEAEENSLTGLEWAMGIPGTVGGAVYGNAKSLGREMSDIVEIVESIDVKTGVVKNFTKKECQFSYKESIFKKKKNLVILSVVMRLERSIKNDIQFRVRENLEYRKRTQPLDFPSVGSIFKNVAYSSIFNNNGSSAKKKKLLQEFPDLNDFKDYIPAGWLIDKCGLKGKKMGDVKVSEKHANFIINLGQGKEEDVKLLINFIKTKVKNKFGVILEEEVQFL